MNGNQKKIIMSLSVILLLIIISFSASYAYIMSTVKGNDSTEYDVITSINNLELVIDSTSQIIMTDIDPGDELTKSFSITNEGSTIVSGFIVSVSDVVNTYAVPEELVYTISCVASSGSCSGHSETEFPTSSGSLMTSDAINPGVTNTYTITVKLKEMGSNQNYNAGGVLKYTITISENYRLLSLAINRKSGSNDEISIKTTPTFTGIPTTDEGMFATTDQDGATYYYRGLVTNNYVNFADKIWRIVRVNGDGTIRLILNSYAKDESSSTYFLPYNANAACANNTVNSQAVAINCVRYKNGDYSSNSISNYVDTWYSNNIDTTNDNYVATGKFCNNYAFNTSNNYFISLYNLNTLHTPALQCTNNGSYTAGTAETIQTKAGLLSADELNLAGGVLGVANTSYYLYIGTGSWWTMSPRRSSNITAGTPEVYKSSNSYSIDYVGANSYSGPTNYFAYIRPVINLKSNILVTGDGTSANPYTVYGLK